MTKTPGSIMRAEINEAPARFAAMVQRDLTSALNPLSLDKVRAIYSVARGSSDAAANILSYEIMARLRLPMTSLPPSVFSLGNGVAMEGTLGLILSQSGASSDLVQACRGIAENGGQTLLITNSAASPASALAQATIDIGAGPELAIPATKSVVATIAAGMAFLARLDASYRPACEMAAQAMLAMTTQTIPNKAALETALSEADSVFVIGRGCGFGAAQEMALKLKETAAIHAEAYSASEVLHGPLQLASNPLTVLILDTGENRVQDSLNTAETRLRGVGARVFRISPADFGVTDVSPAGAAAILLAALYPVVHDVTLQLGLNPDTPENLAKITDTV